MEVAGAQRRDSTGNLERSEKTKKVNVREVG